MPDYVISGIIGKGGKHIAEIEDYLGISLDIKEIEGKGFEKYIKKGKRKKRKNR